MRKNSTLSIIRSAFLLSILLMGGISSTSVAIDEDFYRGNDIFFYEEGATGSCITPGTNYTTRMDIPTLTGATNAEKIWNFFINKGLNAIQTAGVMGNIKKESNFEPGIEEGQPSWAGAGFGIMQWTGTDSDGDGVNDNNSEGPIRRTQLENAAKDAGVQADDLAFQLAYVYQEIQGMQVGGFGVNSGRPVPNTEPTDDLWEALKKQDSIVQATVLFHDGFLRSNDSTEEIRNTRAAKFAQDIHREYSGLTGETETSTSTPSSASGGQAGCAPFAGGDLIQTVLAYAWPEYHAGDYLDMMPEYAKAVKKGQADGKNVGGGIHPGIDCAGFVNLVITDSGFDPSYNYNGKGNDSVASTGEAQHRVWMEENWQRVGDTDGYGEGVDIGKLQPGDVGVTKAGSGQHIFIYVGDIDGFEGKFASASYGTSPGSGVWRAPMSAGDYESNKTTNYLWFRKGSSSNSTYE